ncbi:uncharacterized protein A4U43_C09F15450 [Asparagus officinalis]|uniref:Uncharacterized protein n=1 Tax=Asparagus officinalis TaxID=4686 RepID=A0A5P1E871_ASPOF|nr:uncharacterized protein A4U43_C09F15450 [Asparagus officinalis]
MTLLCFLLDLRTIPPPLLSDLKQSLLQLANLYAVTRGKDRCEDDIPMLRDLIGLCYIENSPSSSSPELKIVYRPGKCFSLRDFHHAVNNMPMNYILPNNSIPTENSQEVSLTCLFSEKALYAWGGDDITKKVIAVSTTGFTSIGAFQKSLMDAAEHCVTVEFTILEQKDMNLYSGTSEKLTEFVNSIHELENCVLHRYLPDSWLLCGLVKGWLQELRNDIEEPLQAMFLFKNTVGRSIKQLSCNLSASSVQIIDGFTPCQT